MQSWVRGGLAAGILLLAGAAQADDGAAVGVSLEASTLGAGLSVGVPVGKRFNVRGVYHAFTYDTEFEDDSGATYDGEFDLQSVGLLADWHPFKGAFRLTAGLASNGNQINMTGTDDGSGVYEVGGCAYQSDPGDPLRIDGTTKFNGTAPYVGIGWGGNLNARPGLYVTLDLGVLLSGAPDTELTGQGSVTNATLDPTCGVGTMDASNSPEFQQALRDAEDEANRETEKYEFWPNVAIGIGWRF